MVGVVVAGVPGAATTTDPPGDWTAMRARRPAGSRVGASESSIAMPLGRAAEPLGTTVNTPASDGTKPPSEAAPAGRLPIVVVGRVWSWSGPVITISGLGALSPLVAAPAGPTSSRRTSTGSPTRGSAPRTSISGSSLNPPANHAAVSRQNARCASAAPASIRHRQLSVSPSAATRPRPSGPTRRGEAPAASVAPAGPDGPAVPATSVRAVSAASGSGVISGGSDHVSSPAGTLAVPCQTPPPGSPSRTAPSSVAPPLVAAISNPLPCTRTAVASARACASVSSMPGKSITTSTSS